MINKKNKAFKGNDMKSIKYFLAAIVVSLAALATPATANILTYQGITFEWASAGSYLELSISEDALNGGTGNWEDITHLAAFQIGIDGLTDASVAAPPVWNSSPSGLNAKGCEGGSGTGRICFDTTDPLALTDDILFGITLSPNVDPDLVTEVHLKVAFIDQDTYNTYFDPWSKSYGTGKKDYWQKTGDLLSVTIPEAVTIPEPETYALMLTGLGIMGWVVRRKKRKQADAV
jgi:hypothetical protein